MILKIDQILQFLLVLAGGAVLCIAANAADVSKKSDIESNYQRERASCLNGTSNEDRTTCLKEAGAALAEARKGRLDEPNKNFKQNATERCELQSGDDRDACMARMKGKGVTTEGSVESGGVLREMRTTTPAASGSASAAK